VGPENLLKEVEMLLKELMLLLPIQLIGDLKVMLPLFKIKDNVDLVGLSLLLPL
jgi:hypothetical protein